MFLDYYLPWVWACLFYILFFFCLLSSVLKFDICFYRKFIIFRSWVISLVFEVIKWICFHVCILQWALTFCLGVYIVLERWILLFYPLGKQYFEMLFFLCSMFIFWHVLVCVFEVSYVFWECCCYLWIFFFVVKRRTRDLLDIWHWLIGSYYLLSIWNLFCTKFIQNIHASSVVVIFHFFLIRI